MPRALGNYRAFQRSGDRWALGRFVIPVGCLSELERLLTDSQGEPIRGLDDRFPLAVVFGSGAPDDVDAVDRFNRGTPEHHGQVETVEVKVSSPGVARAVLAGIPPGWARYLEVPLGENSEATLDTVAAGHAFAKIRTGGTTPEAFPLPDTLIAFLEAAAARKLAFKATAGLHHPLRGSYRLTYADGSPSGMMYGYLNVLLAAAILWTGGTAAQAREALLEENPAALRFEVTSLGWRDFRIDRAALAGMRQNFFHGFGSCSFSEPLDGLAAGGWA